MTATREPSIGNSGNTDPTTQTLGKACVTCGATKTPLWRCNVDGQKTLCNRCGVRLYREQERAQGAEEDVTAKEDDKDDSSSCTFAISNDSSRESSPPRSSAKRKRQVAQVAPMPPAADRAASVEDELLCWPSVQLASQQDLAGSHRLMLAAAPALVAEEHSSFLKRLCTKELPTPSSSSDDSLFLLAPSRSPSAECPVSSPVVAQAQRALKQAWPTLVAGHLGHLWEAGLDPLDPLFLANINDPAVHLGHQDSQALIPSSWASVTAEHFSLLY